jgi:nucleotide-binding universal stress UspA family protein
MEERSIMKILVPVDGSKPSLRAVRLAIAMARSSPRSEILLVNVQNTGTLEFGGLGSSTPVLLRQAVEREGEAALKPAVALCKAAKLSYHAQIETGPIAETAMRVAKRKRATHIVMGTRGLGGIRNLVLGSVATQIIHLATVPVTLVK